MKSPVAYGYYKHKKSGKEYQLVGFANLSATSDSFVATAIYQSLDDCAIWARPLCEFAAKFVEI